MGKGARAESPREEPGEKEKRLIAIAEDAERKYTRVQQLLTAFLGNMPALSFIKDEDGRYLYASKSFAQFFGVEPDKFLGKTDFEWLPPEIAQQFFDNDEQVRSTGQPIEVIERVPRDGKVIESIVQKFPMWVGNEGEPGARPMVGGVAIDITERQKNQTRITELVAELENLAYAVSHELQEPVNKIKSYQNLLAVRYKDRFGPDADQFIQHCSSAASTIDKMVTDLWTFARVSRQSNFGRVDSNQSLKEALERLQDDVKSRSASVACADLPKVNAVEKQVVDLFEQLIKNAIQSCEETPAISITSTCGSDFHEFCVQDNGIGIDPMLAKDIFKLFRRKASQRPDASGAGMGLAICRRIVEHHGGTLRVESQPGEGARFYFSLPVAND